jgi:Sjoegren syndrome nuclear autoantigen 1
MAAVGADVQATSNELVQLIEELKERRSELDRVIKKEEEEKLRLLAELRALNERLQLVEDSLQKKHAARGDFERTIQDTSNAFNKILESSRMLLSSVKQDTMLLAHR